MSKLLKVGLAFLAVAFVLLLMGVWTDGGLRDRLLATGFLFGLPGFAMAIASVA